VASRENKHIKLTTEVIEYIREKLKEYWCTDNATKVLSLDIAIGLRDWLMHTLSLNNPNNVFIFLILMALKALR
jgi:hypothetical protein